MSDSCKKPPSGTKRSKSEGECGRPIDFKKGSGTLCKPVGMKREKPKEAEPDQSHRNTHPPSVFRRIGKKQIEVLSLFSSTIVIYTVAAALCTVYFCEWKAVLQYVPYYGGKYKDEEKRRSP